MSFGGDLTGDHKCGIIVALICAGVTLGIAFAMWDYHKFAKTLEHPEFTARVLGFEEAR